MKTFEYRLFVKKQQHALLMQSLRETRLIYNEMLEITKQQYEQKGTFPTKYDLTAQFKGRGGEHVPATTVQMLADRLTKSLKRFLARVKAGGNASRWRTGRPDKTNSKNNRSKTPTNKRRPNCAGRSCPSADEQERRSANAG